MRNRLFTATCNSLAALVGFLAFSSCASDNQNLCVDKFTLRSIKIEDTDHAMVRGDQQKRLYGAVSLKEHQQRIGQNYVLRWNLKNQELSNNGNSQAQLVFRFKKAATGAKIHTLTKLYPYSTHRGKWEVNNIGDNYAKNGRILAWRADLIYGGRGIASKESYLWKP